MQKGKSLVKLTRLVVVGFLLNIEKTSYVASSSTNIAWPAFAAIRFDNSDEHITDLES